MTEKKADTNMERCNIYYNNSFHSHNTLNSNLQLNKGSCCNSQQSQMQGPPLLIQALRFRASLKYSEVFKNKEILLLDTILVEITNENNSVRIKIQG
ncbi:unnamed protein product [Paramecium octaurelia]|uniref:Uncharacterized protein n=1 Tax=Paramecium octaurelia TaxID=43137 RepID=A0A8S1WS30_PAROT|nr:unnamed protein product [Paramecium octaurelia]